jgi:ERCC4-type nuclease
LPIGDIILSDKENDLVIIERKTVNDLLASIKDGRYEEQSYRLNGSSYHNHNIIYLIEGDINRVNRFKDNRIDKTTLYSSLFSLNYYKGFSVLRTFSIEETAFFICNTICKLKKGMTENKKAYYINHTCLEEDKDKDIDIKNDLDKNDEEKEENIPYVNVIKKVKKENITPENIGEIMLCQIPGISSVTAIAIMSQYKCIKNLMEEIEKDNSCLEKITYVNTKGQTRKLNKSCIKNINVFLLQNKV